MSDLKKWLRAKVKAFIRKWKKRGTPYQRGCKKLAKKLWHRTEGRIFAGPFAGMKIPFESIYASQPNLMVGCYELELTPAVLELTLWQPSLVVNIGAAEGYYAVGMALAIPNTQVIAYDFLPAMQALCKRTAMLNGVADRITIKGHCQLADLAIEHAGKIAIICDCEGCEYDLLDPVKIPSLQQAFIICELHDFNNPKITSTLIARFGQSHDIELKIEVAKTANHYRILDGLSVAEQRLAVHENRHVKGIPFCGRYMILRPKGIAL